MWYIACNASRKRAALIVAFRNDNTYDEFITEMSQERIYQAQKDVYINPNKVIAILNSVPLFLIEYYGESLWNEACVQKAGV